MSKLLLERSMVKSPPAFLELDFDTADVEHNSSVHGQAECFMPFKESAVFCAPIKNVRVLADDEDKEGKTYLEFTFDITDNPINFLPGDTIAIIPQNADEAVSSFLELFRLGGMEDVPYALSLHKSVQPGKRITLPMHLPRKSTLKQVFRDCISFKFPQKKQFYRMLHDYAEDFDKTTLKSLCGKDSKALETLLKSPDLSIIEFIKSLPSCRPPIVRFLENLCRLQPKPYSIVNSPLWNKTELKIALSIVKNRSGETTRYLKKLSDMFLGGTKKPLNVWMYLRKPNTFRYTDNDFSKNIIMVGVGCAIAPFISFMQHKAMLQHQGAHGYPGQAWLFVGFKKPDLALFTNEIDEFLHDGIIDRAFESFSRETSQKQKYVQDHILENAKQFVDLLYQDTLLYVCADGSDICKSIETTIETAIIHVLDCSYEEAQDTVAIFKSCGKYRQDLWV